MPSRTNIEPESFTVAGHTMPLLPRQVRQQVIGAERAALSCRINRSALPPDLEAADRRADDLLHAPVQLSTHFRKDERLDSQAREAGTISRADVLRIAAALPAEPSDDALRTFLVNVHAWSYGPVGFGYSQTMKVQAALNLAQHSASAGRALRSLGPTAAYASLYNGEETGSRGLLRVDGWGPALFTKYLYFIDPQNQPDTLRTRPTALILDRTVAVAVNSIVPFKPLGAFGLNGWTAPQYAFYTALMARIAGELSTPTTTVGPWMVEAAISEHYRG
ncbi:MAG: hypothetical protein JWQ74_1850 [Marmoricola sp.]|nr:hypothetical protein [Marmoricola sp.]